MKKYFIFSLVFVMFVWLILMEIVIIKSKH